MHIIQQLTLNSHRISALQGDFEKALQQVNESLTTNSLNNSATGLKSSILRRLGNYKSAVASLSELPQK